MGLRPTLPKLHLYSVSIRQRLSNEQLVRASLTVGRGPTTIRRNDYQHLSPDIQQNYSFIRISIFFQEKVFAVLGYLDFDLLLYTAFTVSTAYRFWLDFPRTAKGFQPFKPNQDYSPQGRLFTSDEKNNTFKCVWLSTTTLELPVRPASIASLLLYFKLRRYPDLTMYSLHIQWVASRQSNQDSSPRYKCL